MSPKWPDGVGSSLVSINDWYWWTTHQTYYVARWLRRL